MKSVWLAVLLGLTSLTANANPSPLLLDSLGDAESSLPLAWQSEAIEVYATDASVLLADGNALRPIPRSTQQLHRLEGPDGELGVIARERDGAFAFAAVLDGTKIHQGTLALDSQGRAVVLFRPLEEFLPEGVVTAHGCDSSSVISPTLLPSLAPPGTYATATSGAPMGALVQAILAIDTDNEFMSQKFSNNTTAANNYVVQLVALMSVIYERDLNVRLAIGATILRTTADPYAATGNDTAVQLNEFGEFWRVNQGGISRAFALQLSGKSPMPNWASGIAWLLTSGNYCTSTGQVFAGGTFGHYSVNQVFKFAGSTAASDVALVAHELGHNFAASHTHCTDTSQSAGLQPIDMCFNAETGCHAGPVSCPAATGGQGTLMSYCNFAPPNGANCGLNVRQEFHPVHITQLSGRVLTNTTNGCLTPAGGALNQPPVITRPGSLTVTEDVASSITGISFADPDIGGGTLTATFSVGAGTFNSPGCANVTSGPSASARTLTGTLGNLNSCVGVGSFRYSTAADSTTSVTMTVTANDNGNTGTGGAMTDTEMVTLNITAVNDAPVSTVPASIAVNEDVATGLAGISFADVDSGGGAITVTLSVPNGSIDSPVCAGVAVTGSATSRQLTGTLAQMNACFGSASRPRFTTAPNATTNVQLTVSVSDNGNTGTGGSGNDSDPVTLMVTAVNDAPSVMLPASIPILVPGTLPLRGIVVADVDSAAGNVTATLSVPIGTLSAIPAGGVAVAGSGTATLALSGNIASLAAFFASDAVSYIAGGNTTLTVSLNDQGNFGSGGPQATVAMTPLVRDDLFANSFE